ncbi:hypothetical protein BJAS_P4365 [Bathymodiolus japonicus methanotrophic gill symbiont]|nr:hypothetical protein BJAS_P4365 [Bathymodiolus japonicus methanotrophic gill symbiont]
MPESVNQAMNKAAFDIWAAASGLAGESVERIQKEAGDAITKAKAELSEYAGEVSRLERELEQANLKTIEQIKKHGESLFLRKLVLGIPAQASSKNLTRPLMPPAAPIRPRHLVPTQQGVGT